MSKPTTAALCALTLALSGCSGHRAEMYATAEGHPGSVLAPQGGIVRYSRQGSDEARRKSREDAEGLMGGYCRGGYSIVTEGLYRIMDLGANIMSVGEGGVAVQSSEEDYWLIVFSCGASSAETPSAAAPARPRPAEPLDPEALRNLPPDQAYPKLLAAERGQAAAYLDSLPKKQLNKLTEHVLDTKGDASGLSWQFRLARKLSTEETRFVSWYLLNYTDYKPSF